MTYPHSDSDNSVPFDSADDYELADGPMATKTAEEIENESRRDIPVGDHTLVVSGFRGPVEEKIFAVSLNGIRQTYTAGTVRVLLSLPGTNQTAEDYLVLPPSNPADRNAYFDGMAIDDYNGQAKKGAVPGFMAKKFAQFIQRIGFIYPPGGNLPAEAKRLGNWKGRLVRATVIGGGQYEAKDGSMKPRNNQIKLMSYRPADGAGVALGYGTPQVAHVAPSQAAASMNRQPVMAGGGGGGSSSASDDLDNI